MLTDPASSCFPHVHSHVCRSGLNHQIWCNTSTAQQNCQQGLTDMLAQTDWAGVCPSECGLQAQGEEGKVSAPLILQLHPQNTLGMVYVFCKLWWRRACPQRQLAAPEHYMQIIWHLGDEHNMEKCILKDFISKLSKLCCHGCRSSQLNMLIFVR